MILRNSKKYDYFSMSKIIYLAQVKASTALLVPVEVVREDKMKNLVIWTGGGRKEWLDDCVIKGFLYKSGDKNKYFLRVGLGDVRKNIIFIQSIQKELKKYGIKSYSSFLTEFVL